jgi:prophage antirepressor-like protein
MNHTGSNDTLLCPANERGPAQKFSSEQGYVYVIEDENHIIKVGHSVNPTRRIKEIQRCCGLCVVRQQISPLCSNYKEIEMALLNEFGERLKPGEHLRGVSFEEVCAALERQPFQTALLPTTTTAGFVPFQFQDYSVRVILDEQGNPLLVAKDVCDSLGIDVTQIRRLEDDEKGLYSIQTLGGEQKLLCVNEAGLYNLILGCRKFKDEKGERIRAFKRWVMHDVLPQIRKQGYYSLYGQVTPSTQSLVNEVAQATVMQITQALAPITKKPVVVVKAHKNGTAKKVEVSFQVKLSFQIEES